jgi:glycosyltransferase involved in cell wall biosynthesis
MGEIKNVLIVAPHYLPFKYSGGETYLHQLVRNIQDDYKIYAFIYRNNDNISRFEKVTFINDVYSVEPDIIISQLGGVGLGCNLKRRWKKAKHIHIVHNSNHFDQLNYYCDVVIYNTYWLKDYHRYKVESYVIHPPLRDEVTSSLSYPLGKYITMINLNENKGGYLFREIVKQMPDRQFLTVKGGYGEQIIPEGDNVKVIENGEWEITKIIKNTHTLLMLSKYESYGITAVEFAYHGRRVIATNTPGLRESVGAVAYFVDRDVAQVVNTIKQPYEIKRLEFNSELENKKFRMLINQLTENKINT